MKSCYVHIKELKKELEEKWCSSWVRGAVQVENRDRVKVWVRMRVEVRVGIRRTGREVVKKEKKQRKYNKRRKCFSIQNR